MRARSTFVPVLAPSPRAKVVICGTEKHPYELYLDLNGIEHCRTKVRSPKTNGFVECFNGTVLDELLRVKMRGRF
jgi:transposase InsO family protein